MGKKLSQLNSIDSVSGDEFLLVDGQNFLESKKIKIKDIKPYILSEQTGGVGQFTDTQGEIFNDYETNKALTKFSHSEGTQSVASCLGFKILNISDSGLGLRLEGDATALLDSSIIANRNDYGLENSISFQWGQNFDLCCNITVAEYQSGTNTTNIMIDKCPDGFDLSLATSGWLWVPLNPEIGNIQIGVAAHTEGYANKAIQIASHAEGYNNIAAGKYSHTEGKNTIAVYAAHSEGMNNKSLGICSHTEGSQNIATRDNTHAEGTYTQALFDNAHAEGSHTIAGTSTGGNAAHAEGSLSQALGDASHAEGNETQATAQYAHVEGDKSIASGVASHAEGNGVASGALSHAEGNAIASNEKAHAEGSSSKATGKISHAEGDSTNANGLASHAEGSWTIVDADFGHSEGTGTVVSSSARGGHAEGVSTKAQKEGAHAEGVNTNADAKGAHAGGIGTVAILDAQTTIGRYNAEEWDGSLFVIGNGSAPVKDENGNITTPEIRSTIFKVKDNGDVILKSGLIKGVKTPIDNTDAVNKQYVDGAINNINIPTVVQEAGNSESLVMSQKAVTDLVSSAIGTTEYETVDSVNEMTDTTKSYILSTTGTIWTYGEVTTEKEAENKFVPSTATLNARLSGSSGSVSANSGGSLVTNFIAVSDLNSITPFNVRLNWEMIQSDDNKVLSYDSNKTRLSNNILNMVETATNPANAVIENGETIIDIKTKGANAVVFPNWANVAYLRFQLFVKPKGTSITSTDVENLTITFDAESGTITENKWYDTGLTPSTSENENYVGLLVKINENTSNINEIDNRVTALETGSNSVTIPSFWQNAVDNCITKIKNLQVGRNCVTFPFFSDNHQRNGYAGMLIAHIMKECNIPYCFFGGDSIDSGYIASESVMIAQDKKFDTMMSYVPNGRLCRAVGNHDGYWAVSADEKHYYTDAQNYELFLREESIAQNKHFGGDGTYYYIDDVASKVRWIVLDTNDAIVEAEQLSWLQNTAMSFNESGWAIVFISHQPISNHYHANISNAAEVRTIVSNYINGSSSNKADVIGWFSGHIHRDRIYEGVAVNTTDDSIGAAMPFKQVTITSDHTGISYDNATKHTVANDDKSHAIDFVTINKNTRTVNLTRLGIGEDRSYSY